MLNIRRYGSTLYILISLTNFVVIPPVHILVDISLYTNNGNKKKNNMCHSVLNHFDVPIPVLYVKDDYQIFAGQACYGTC